MFFAAAGPLVVLGAGSYRTTAIRRSQHLRTMGYYSRRFRDAQLIYEEHNGAEIRSLVLNLEPTEPGHYVLFIPEESVWSQSVPEWAVGRRSEISKRIAETWIRAGVHIE